MDFLAQLNSPQQQAVTTTDGPLLVLAGAGSGKTRVITYRIAHLLRNKVPARAILAVTFTNKAAAEMKERVVHLCGRGASQVSVCTFHAFGAEVLRQEIHRLGWPRRFAIADMGDQLALVKRAMRERSVDDRSFDARKVLTAISRAKCAGIVPEPKPEGMGDDYDLVTHLVFPLYELGLKAQGAVDFDDLILLPSRLFKEHPEVRERYVQRFRYLLVDEFQDTNRSQLELLKLLTGERPNVCAVGDDDQCIYSWRGAEVRNILEFERAFPGAQEVRLEQNYRSTRTILEASNAVIAKNPRRPKRMWTDGAQGGKIQVVALPSEDDEARYVAQQIARLTGEGVPRDEIAVLYRTNGQSRPIEEALREKEIPYEVIGGSEFYDRREIKDVIAYFKVLANPLDEVSLLRIINVPARGIGDATVERLSVAARAAGRSLFDTLPAADQIEGLTPGAAQKVQEFRALLDRYRALLRSASLVDLARRLLEEIDFRDHYRAHASSATAADKKVKSIDQVLVSINAYVERDGPKADLLSYLNRLTLDTKDDEEGPSGQRCVTLLTLHAAKGLEYQVVFLIGLEEDLLPHSGMQGEPPNPEEERRLCYVGMTRARRTLYLTRATARIKRGKEIPRTPSRFLADIPAELCEVIDTTVPPPGPPSEKELKFFSSLKERLKAGSPAPAGPKPGT